MIKKWAKGQLSVFLPDICPCLFALSTTIRGQCIVFALCLSHFLREFYVPQSTYITTDKCGLNCSPAVGVSLIIQPNCLDLSPPCRSPWLHLSLVGCLLDTSRHLTHKSFGSSTGHPAHCVKRYSVTIWILCTSLLQPPNESFGLVQHCWLLYFMTFKCVGKLSSLDWMLKGS